MLRSNSPRALVAFFASSPMVLQPRRKAGNGLRQGSATYVRSWQRPFPYPRPKRTSKKPGQTMAATQNAAIEIALSVGGYILKHAEKMRAIGSQDCKTHCEPPIFTHLLPDSLRNLFFSNNLRVLAASLISIPQQRWT
jgi:hypothetical protein